MLISKILPADEMEVWEEEIDDECHEFTDHVELKERLRKTLYFGKTPKMDRPSLPMTELAVEYFHDSVPRQLGKVDMYWASSVTRKASVSPCAMMLGMLYIERLKHRNPEYIQKMTSEELFLVSMMLASKYLQDEGVSEEVYNDEWADSANLDLEDLNQLERDFLSAIDWNLYVTPEAFNASLIHTEQQLVLRQVLGRGFYTYTELWILLYDSAIREQISNALDHIYKVVVVCTVVYVAGTIMVVGGAMVLSSLRLASIKPYLSPSERFPASFTASRLSVQEGAPQVSHLNQLMIADENRSLSHQGAPLTFPELETSYVELSPAGGAAKYKQERPPSDKTSANDEAKTSTQEARPSTVTSTVTSICNFLTLTLVKDTLMAFVVGVSSNPSSVDDEDDVRSDGDSGRHVCQCPRCPMTNQKNRSQDNVNNGPSQCRLMALCLTTSTEYCRSFCCSTNHNRFNCRHGDNSCIYGNQGLSGADPKLGRSQSDSAKRSLHTWSQLIQQEAGIMGNPLSSELASSRLQPVSV